LHSRDPGRTLARTSLDFQLVDTNVRVEAPEAVLEILDDTLSFVPRSAPERNADVVVSVTSKDEAWEIYGLAGSYKILGAHSALPQVAGAVVSSVVSDLATRKGFIQIRACVVAKNDRAIALIGDDWESAIALSAHLHGRGWSYVGSDNVLLEPVGLNVFPIQKSLYVNASSVSQLPAAYRRAVEASPWYVTPQGISFYAVDPRSAGYGQTWTSATRLHGVVVIDGSMADRASLESVNSRILASDRFARLGIDWARISTVDLRLGDLIESSDIVEHWFGSIR
jgi:hypothetical protein